MATNQELINLITPELPIDVDSSFETITYAASVTVPFNKARPNKKITLTGNLTLAITGSVNGDSGIVEIIRGTGSETLTFTGSLQGNTSYPTGAGVTVSMTYINDGSIVWYCNNPVLLVGVTQASTDNTTKLATTAMVQSALSGSTIFFDDTKFTGLGTSGSPLSISGGAGVPTGTIGSVPYYDTTSTIGNDATNFNWDSSLKRLNIGIGSNTGTAGIAVYNTVDQATNPERLWIRWASNIASIRTTKAGTGLDRDLIIGTTNTTLQLSETVGPTGFIQAGRTTGNGTANGIVLSMTRTNSSGSPTDLLVNSTFTGTATGGYTLYGGNVTDATATTGTKQLLDLQVNAASRFAVASTGQMKFGGATLNTPVVNGTVSNSAGGTAVTGTGTTFLTTFQVGDVVTIGGQTVAITAIASDTAMTTAAITNANTNITYTPSSTVRYAVSPNGKTTMGGITANITISQTNAGQMTISSAAANIAINAVAGGSILFQIGNVTKFAVNNGVWSLNGTPMSANQILGVKSDGTGMEGKNIAVTQATASLAAQTAAGNVVTFTPTNPGTFIINPYVNTSAGLTNTIQIQVTYTDEFGGAQTFSYPAIAAGTNVMSHYSPILIRSGASIITVKTNMPVSSGSITFQAGATIVQAQ